MITLHQKIRESGKAIWLCVLAAFALTAARAENEAKPLPDDVIQPSGIQAEPGQYSNLIRLGIGDFFVNGDKSQFRYQSHESDGPFGGIEDLHLEKMLGSSKWLLQLDGRAIFNNHDYMVKLDLSNPDIGYIRGGYTEYRTWYDNSGGYYTGGNGVAPRWISLYDNQDFHIDRGDAWVEAGLTLPNMPVIKFRYDYQFRKGTKDSLEWGDYNTNGAASPKKIVPAFRDIDEKRHIITADLTHTLWNTDFDIGMRFESLSEDNSISLRRFPGQNAGGSNRDQLIMEKDGFDTTMFNVHGSTETRINDKALFTIGYSYSKFDTDISGYRYTNYILPAPSTTVNFTNLYGGSQVEEHVANLNLLLNPTKNWSVIPSVRIDSQNMDSFETWNAGSAQTARDFLDVSGGLDVRYTGFKDWSLYARGEWLGEQGNLWETLSPTPSYLPRSTDNNRFEQKYTIGANWYPCARANLSGQYYYRKVENNFDHVIDPTTGANALVYSAFILDQNYDMHDVNFRLTLRPVSGITLVSRYDFQLTSYDMMGQTLADIQTAQRTQHIFSQSMSWMMHPRLYLSGTFSYVFDETKSPATNQVANILQDAKNNYWYGDAQVGFAMTEKTDLQLTYAYYHADNYLPFVVGSAADAAPSMVYGAANESHSFTATVAYQIKPNILWKVRYGYYKNIDNTSGFNNNYDAHLVYSSFEFRF